MIFILNDSQIERRVEMDNLISPFHYQVGDGKISYGLGHFGYDIRVAKDFHIFTDVSAGAVDPKDFSKDSFVQKEVEDYVVIPPNSFALGYAVEKISMPNDLMGLCVGKSTYARCGIIVNMTPVEPGWKGHLTIEISNTSPKPAKVYAMEGIAQVVFFSGKEPTMTYADKSGKYQGQEKKIYHSKVASMG